MGFDFFGYAYAASVVAGGIIGYAKAQSVPSLAAGIIFGGLLAFGAYQRSQNPNNSFISLGASIFLTGLMTFRYFNTGKFIPAGLVASIGLVNVIRLSYKLAISVEK